MCNTWNSSQLATTDCYWLMRQWQSRVKQDRPFIKMNSKSNWCNWLLARWRLNTKGVNLAVRNLGNAITAIRTFEDENAELTEAV